MKKIIVSILIIRIISFSVVYAEQTKRYAIKSGHIVYELTGNVTGEKEVWFDDYGMKSYEEENTSTTIKMFGITNTEKEHSIIIMDGETFYDIDMVTNTCYKGTLPSIEQMQNLANDMTEAEQKQMADDIMKSLDGQKLGEETFLGKTCEVMEVTGIKSWIYNGITLKTEANIMGIVSNETATKFEENVKVPASKFDPPKGITYEEMPSFGNMPGMVEDETYYDDEENADVAVPISFDDFKKGLSNLSNSDYTQTMVMEEEGQYMAMYMSSMGAMLMISATGYISGEYEEGFESFSHKGTTMKYGSIAEGGATISMLLVLYPKNKLIILINSMSGISKDEFIDIADKLNY